MILKGLLNRSPQLPFFLEFRLSKKKSTVSLPRISKVLLVVIHYGNRTESIHEVSAFSSTENAVLREYFGQLDFNEPVATWPAFKTTVGFEVRERPHCKLPLVCHSSEKRKRARRHQENHFRNKDIEEVRRSLAIVQCHHVMAVAKFEAWSFISIKRVNIRKGALESPHLRRTPGQLSRRPRVWAPSLTVQRGWPHVE